MPSPRKIVVLAKDAAEDEYLRTVLAMGGRIVKRLPLINAVVVEGVSSTSLTALSHRHGVVRIEEDVPVRLISHAVVARPWRRVNVEARCATIPWGVHRVRAPEVWGRCRGEGVDVAILDTGIEWDHPDLAARIKGGYNAVGGDDTDKNGHGTHVAGIVAGSGAPGGVYGVAPKAGLWAVKVLRDDGSGSLSDVIDGLSWCVLKRVPVANLSLGTPVSHPLLEQAIDAAVAAGVFLVAAAGNSGPHPNTLEYPAAYSAAFSVGACDHEGRIAPFSSRGASLDVIAPGKDIYSTWLRGGYKRLDGTSMAAPHVAGAAALLLSAGRIPTLSSAADWLRTALLTSAVPLSGPSVDEQGRGVVDVPRALGGI